MALELLKIGGNKVMVTWGDQDGSPWERFLQQLCKHSYRLIQIFFLESQYLVTQRVTCPNNNLRFLVSGQILPHPFHLGFGPFQRKIAPVLSVFPRSIYGLSVSILAANHSIALDNSAFNILQVDMPIRYLQHIICLFIIKIFIQLVNEIVFLYVFWLVWQHSFHISICVQAPDISNSGVFFAEGEDVAANVLVGYEELEEAVVEVGPVFDL